MTAHSNNRRVLGSLEHGTRMRETSRCKRIAVNVPDSLVIYQKQCWAITCNVLCDQIYLVKQRKYQKQTHSKHLTDFPSDRDVISNLLSAPLDRTTPFRFAAFIITFLASLIFPMARSHLTDSGSNLSKRKCKNKMICGTIIL